MKKTVRRMLTVCGAAAMMLSAAQITAFADGDVKEVSLHLPTVYDLPDAPLVEDAINQITEEKYGIHLNLTYITTGNWQQQSNLLFTGDEADVIAVFMTPLSSYVKNGQLTDLTDYYANASDEFKQVWSEDEMRGTTVDGKIYAIPNLRNFGNIIGLNIDSDIAAEFGIENGQKLTMEEVDDFLTKAHEKYPDRYALIPQSGDSMINGDWTRKWYQEGITMQDVLSNTQPFQTLIGNDLAIACFDNYSVNNVPGITRTEVISAWAQSNSYQALCYGINVNSKDKDAAWELMQILYTDKDVCTLLADGIEGTHYTVNDDGTISFVDGKTAADCGYGMAEGYWIVPYSGNTYPLDVNGPTFFDDLLQFNKDTLKTKAFGFCFDTSNVVDQYTACSNIRDKYFKALISGSVDIESTLEQMNSELEAAGLADIIAEKQAQLDAFLAEQQ